MSASRDSSPDPFSVTSSTPLRLSKGSGGHRFSSSDVIDLEEYLDFDLGVYTGAVLLVVSVMYMDQFLSFRWALGLSILYIRVLYSLCRQIQSP